MDTKPTQEFKLGNIRLALWANETDGRTWFSSAPSRRYSDAKSGEAKFATTFNGVTDLVLLGECIQQAIAWLHEQEQEQLGSEE